MDKAVFNTPEAEEILAKAGLEARQAKAVVQVTAKALSEGAATTGDVDKLAGKIGRVESEQKTEIGKLDNKIDKLGNKIDKLGNKIDKLGNKLGNKIDKLGNKIDKVDNKIGQAETRIAARIAEQGQELGRRISTGDFWFVGAILTVAVALFGATIAFLTMGN